MGLKLPRLSHISQDNADVAKKGQMFILGAFVLCMILAGAVLGRNTISTSVASESANNMFTNILAETRNTINIIAKENATSESIESRLLEYSAFLDHVSEEHSINMTGHFVVALPTGEDLNVTVVNFEKSAMKDITLELNTTQNSIATLEHRASKTVVFTGVPEYLSFNYSYSSYNGTGTQVFSEEANTTKRLFSFIKLRFSIGEDIRQSVTFN